MNTNDIILKEKNDNTITNISCKDWNDFKNKIAPIMISNSRNTSLGGSMIYRGHFNAKWKLNSTLERDFYKKIDKGRGENQTKNQYILQIKELLNTIKTISKGNTEIINKIDNIESDLDWWFLGRHYGLPSPYLDWSRSPYVAAFFAFHEEFKNIKKSLHFKRSVEYPQKKVCIWGLADSFIRSEDFDLIDARFSSNGRQRAQQSVFTQLLEDKGRDYISYFKSKKLLE